jgi:hypothetical protein
MTASMVRSASLLRRISGKIASEFQKRVRNVSSKLAPVRTLRARAGLLTQLARAAIQVHERAWCCPLLAEAPVWRAGDVLLAARGCIDGATLSALKRQRPGAGSIALKAPMLATQEASQVAEMAHQWQPHLARADQTRALGRGVEHRGSAWAVPLNACVMRLWQKKQK